MKDRRIPGPPMAKSLLEPSGHGGPQPAPSPGPPPPTVKPGESSPGHPSQPQGNPLQAITDQVTKNVSDALGSSVQSAANSLIGPGEVLLGVALILVGLLLATGQMGRVARGAGRAGLFAATRGAIR